MPQPAHEYDNSPTFYIVSTLLVAIRINLHSILVNDNLDLDDEGLTSSFCDAEKL